MQIQNPNSTPICSTSSAAALRGGATNGSRDGPPPQISGTGIPGPHETHGTELAIGSHARNEHRTASPGGGLPRPGSLRRPDARAGRAFGISLIPVLALLLSALSLFGAAPAAAQTLTPVATTIWSGTLVAKDIGSGSVSGCSVAADIPQGSRCDVTTVLTEDGFTYDGVQYEVTRIATTGGVLEFSLDKAIPAGLRSAAKLHVGQGRYPFSDGTVGAFNGVQGSQLSWSNIGFTKWGEGSSVGLALSVLPPPTVSLSASPNLVQEGSPVTVTATLSRALTEDVSIPLFPRAYTAEQSDHGLPWRFFIDIPAGQTTGTYDITTARDDDEDDERFAVSLYSTYMPSSVKIGSPRSVDVTIVEEWALIHALSPPNEVHEDGYGSVPFTVYIPNAVSYPVSVDYTTADGVASTQWEPRWQEGGHAREPCPHQSAEDIRANGWNCLDGWFRITSQPATSPDDYTATSGRVTLAPGETRKIVRVTIVNDTVEDSGENFRFLLSNPSEGAGLAPYYTEATVLILNDEADLKALSVEAAPDAGGSYAALDIGAFAPETTEYSVTVPHGTTHARLTATAAEDGATLVLHGPGGTAVERGSAIALAAGENALVVKVSLPSGARKTYRVTVTREAQVLSSDADLSGLSAEAGADGSWTALDLGAFAAGTTTYAATVPHGTTHVRLTATAADAGATLKAGAASNLTAVTGGTASGAIALEVGANALKVEVTAADGTVKAYAVTVTRQARAAVTVTLSATPNPVGEGSPVTVRATLQAALADAVTIPLTVTGGTSEDGDHGSLASITLPAGFTSATGTVSTVDDDDGDDETFTVALGSLPSGLTAGATSSVLVTITDKGAQQQQQQQQQQTLDPLTARLRGTVTEHDGETPFMLKLVLSESLDSGSRWPSAASFTVKGGSVESVRRFRPYLYQVHVKPKSWKDVTVTLAGGRGCAEAGAICAADGRSVSNTSSVTVGGPVRIRIENARAKEGKDASLDFAVTLNRAAAHDVSVDYATEDDTATAGADYTAVSGTLTFAAGETAKTVSVPVLDDAHDEGRETMRLLLSNPRGAFLRGVHSKAKGVIVNEDPLQQEWLARFGRTAATDAIAAVTARLETPPDAAPHLTLGGQPLPFGGSGNTGAGLPTSPVAEPAGGDWLGWSEDRDTRVSQSMTTRDLLMGTSFRAVLGQGTGSQFTSWGQGASVSQFSGSVPGLSLSGGTATGSMGMDWERGRLLTGFAMTHSLGEGTAQGAGRSYVMGSTVTTMLPYARFALSERVSAWGLAGTGTGHLTLDLDGGAPERYRTDLSMKLAAAGLRGELVTPVEAGGFALAFKVDGFWVRTESEAVSAPGVGNLAAARADVSRLRMALDGSRTFALARGGTLTPSLELGLRHDGGDAETGTGVELGAGLGYADPSRGLDMALRVHGLAGHAEDGYGEWGVSGSLRLVPGAAGRGLSASLTPSYGADPGGSGRLWGLPDVSGLAPADDDADPSSRLDAEVGYGMALFGGAFTGTPNAGFGLSDTAREVRMGWQLSPAGAPDDFSFRIEAARRESVGDTPEHRIGFGVTSRW